MVNPNEAPEGYVAVAYVAGKSSCEECSFASEDCCCRAAGVSCLSLLRDDNCGVYFIPKKEPKEMSHTEDTQPVPSVIPGVSLRDYFAGCAITGLLAANQQGGCVVNAYEVADAMLEERENSLNGGDNATAN